jgi:DNA-binding transcriptional regulator GbsR (MarR family)
MIASKTRREMVESCGRLFQLLGLPRSTGQIYGLLYLSARPLALDDIVELLAISKGSASTGTRLLMSWGAIHQVWVPGTRRDHFQVIADLRTVLRASIAGLFRPRLVTAQRRLEVMSQSLDEDIAQGALSLEEYQLCRERLRDLARIQGKLLEWAPLAERLL